MSLVCHKNNGWVCPYREYRQTNKRSRTQCHQPTLGYTTQHSHSAVSGQGQPPKTHASIRRQLYPCTRSAFCMKQYGTPAMGCSFGVKGNRHNRHATAPLTSRASRRRPALLFLHFLLLPPNQPKLSLGQPAGCMKKG